MEDIRKVVASPDFEKTLELLAQLRRGDINEETQFEFAWYLVRSKLPVDIKNGISMLEDLLRKGDDAAKRDYLFYLAIGNAKLREYTPALRYIGELLSVEPSNRQAKELEDVIKKGIAKEKLTGIAIVGGVAIALGSLIGLGIAMARKDFVLSFLLVFVRLVPFFVPTDLTIIDLKLRKK